MASLNSWYFSFPIMAIWSMAMISPPWSASTAAPRIVSSIRDQDFHPSPGVIGFNGSGNRGGVQAGNPVRDLLFTGHFFIQADASKLGIDEQGIWDGSVLCCFLPVAKQPVIDDPEIVVGDMGEFRSAFAIAQGINVPGRCFEFFIHPDVSLIIGFDTGG